MTEIDSRTETVKPDVASPFESSSQGEDWGQPPVSEYTFWIVGSTLYGQQTSGFYVSRKPPNILLDSQDREERILIASGILPRLIAQAQQVPPSSDWERDLDEL